MVVPDPSTPGAPDKLEEGQIWGCIRCGSAHEYYLVLSPGVRDAGVRLHLGPHSRQSSEPLVQEFVEPDVSR